MHHFVKHTILAFIAFSPFHSVTQAQQLNFAKWHAGYDVPQIMPDFEVSLELDHLSGNLTGQADLSIFQQTQENVCPREMHPDFCFELAHVRDVNSGSYIALNVEGVHYGKTEAYIAFSFEGDDAIRLLKLEESASSPDGYLLTIVHPHRGIDLQAFAASKPHICTYAPCTDDRMTMVSQEPDVYYGVLRDRSFIAQYPFELDERKGANSLVPNNDVASNSSEADFEPVEDMESGDMPGIGVTGPAYQLRNVPEGRLLSLRSEPARGSDKTGAIPSDADYITLSGCTPDVDNLTFEQADIDARLDLLSRSWCLINYVDNNGQAHDGYVPGAYLQPMSGG